ncbi:MAG: hypothetical protein A2539_03390 [Elusimicrobia bacterium RIFOXYD2_FULL_34_15]|nr:MAG: hypothetical protein A2539_03390 [Elusimicrobia bacterium RIFOXYD2_FULL_34_15]
MKRYVMVGASGRGLLMYAKPIQERFSDVAQVVGIFDVNPLRSKKLRDMAGLNCKIYTDFDKMIKETKPDAAIVTTVDKFHHIYIVKALDAGIDAITEKPMTIDAEKCRAILDAEKRTGKKVIVTFNYRVTSYMTKIKELISEGIVGKILNVDFEYMLDTSHGADYFRRWHRRKENSGGLLVHKSTHHFDLINWWLGERPETLMAFGSLRFYGHSRKERGERCLTCKYTNTCEFYFDIAKDIKSGFPSKDMYLETESADKYYRDKCIFADEIDIEDTMSVNLKYSGGALLSYSLIAHCPYEGLKISINGVKGRLEIREYHTGIRACELNYSLKFYNRKGEMLEYIVPKATGSHWGGDARLQDLVFRKGVPDPLGYKAGSYDGSISILIGIAANKSIKDGKAIKINDLVPLDKYFGKLKQKSS